MKFEVDIDQMQNMVQQLTGTLNNITKNKDAMYASIEALDGMWKGPAHDAFLIEYQTDHEKMVQLIRDIGLVFTDIDQARQAYVNCENSVKGMIDAIHI